MSARRRSLPKPVQSTSLLGHAVFFGAVYSALKEGHGLRTIWLTGCLLDTYRALRIIRPNGRVVGVLTRKKAMRDALNSWIVYVVVQQLGPLLNQTLSWLPFYAPLSTLLSLAFLVTRQQSSAQIYASLIRPTLKRYEIPIDLTVLLLRSIVDLVSLYLILEPIWACKRAYRLIVMDVRSRLGAKHLTVLMDEAGDRDIVNPCSPHTLESQPPVVTATLPASARASSPPPDPPLPPTNVHVSPPRDSTGPETTDRTRPHPERGSSISSCSFPINGRPPAIPTVHTVPSAAQGSTAYVTVRRPRPLDRRKPNSALKLPPQQSLNTSSTATEPPKPDATTTRVGPSMRSTNTIREKPRIEKLGTQPKMSGVKTTELPKPSFARSRLASISHDAVHRSSSLQTTRLDRIRASATGEVGATGLISARPTTLTTLDPMIRGRFSPRKRPRSGHDFGSANQVPGTTRTQTKQTKRHVLERAVPESKRRRVGPTDPRREVELAPGRKGSTLRRKMEVYEDG